MHLSCMAERKPILEHQLPKVYAALGDFPLRGQVLLTPGLNPGFRGADSKSMRIRCREQAQKISQIPGIQRLIAIFKNEWWASADWPIRESRS